MNLSDWLINTLSSSVAVVVMLFLFKSLITTRLTQSVRHEFERKIKEIEYDLNSKLAKLSSDYRKSEEEFKADLKTKELEIAALNSAGLGSRSSRLAEVGKRRLAAIDQIWQAIQGIQDFEPVAAFMSILKVQPLAEEIKRNPDAKIFLKNLDLDLKKAKGSFEMAHMARPYVSEMSWAYYNAYSSIVTNAVAMAHILNAGQDPTKFMDQEKIKALITAAIPYASDYIDKFGAQAAYNFLGQIKDQLLIELRKTMDGIEEDLQSLQRAKQIIKAASNLKDEIDNPTIGRS